MVVRTRTAPVAKSYEVKLSRPVIRSNESGMHYKRTEQFATILTNATPGVDSYFCLRVNPGLPQLPELAKAASQYDFYSIRSITMRYVPSISNNFEGRWLMAHDPDTSDCTPPTFEKLAQMDGNISKAMREPGVLRARCSSARKRIRDGPMPGELQSFDCGLIWFRFVSPAAGANAGTLYVDYDFQFYRPSPSGTLHIPNMSIVGYFPNGQSFKVADPDSNRIAPVQFNLSYDTLTTLQPVVNPNVTGILLTPGCYWVTGSFSIEYDNPLGNKQEFNFQWATNSGEFMSKCWFTAHQGHVGTETLGYEGFIIISSSTSKTFYPTFRTGGSTANNLITSIGTPLAAGVSSSWFRFYPV
jgi:hypothetical protein